MANKSIRSPGFLLEYLPAIYQEDPFIGQFLLAFEKILLGNDDVGLSYEGLEEKIEGLEEKIDRLSDYFNPKKAPEEFLSWLADWTAFTIRSDLNLEQRRKFIANIIQRYQWRGTKKNMGELLKIFSVGVPTVDEAASSGLQIGDQSTIGEDTYIGGGSSHFFRVTIKLAKVTEKLLAREFEIIRALIELEKPAHTFYELKVNHPTMKIGDSSTVGVDTILGVADS